MVNCQLPIEPASFAYAFRTHPWISEDEDDNEDDEDLLPVIFRAGSEGRVPGDCLASG